MMDVIAGLDPPAGQSRQSGESSPIPSAGEGPAIHPASPNPQCQTATLFSFPSPPVARARGGGKCKAVLAMHPHPRHVRHCDRKARNRPELRQSTKSFAIFAMTDGKNERKKKEAERRKALLHQPPRPADKFTQSAQTTCWRGSAPIAARPPSGVPPRL
jgi:hypothetical protein